MRSAPRRRFVQALAAGAAGAAVPALRSQPGDPVFPSRALTLWVPWQAGGATDQTLRLLAELAARGLGQKVHVENRPGAGGTLVMPVLQQAVGDAHVLAQITQPVFRAPFLQKVLWDPLRDTTPILQISGTTFGIVVPADSPFRTLDELLSFAAAHPGELTVATNGHGTTPHLVMDELLSRRGTRYVHLPYKGVAEQMLAVASGQVMAGAGAQGYAPFVESGRVRLLATSGAERSRRFAAAPTLKELGHGIVALSPYGLAAPRGVPKPAVTVLHDAFRSALFDPAFVAELARFDQVPAYLGPEDYAQAMRDAVATEKRVVERLGLARP